MRVKDYSKTLFVCSGNIYRSTIAEALFKKRAEDFRPRREISVKSRGTDLYYCRPNPILYEIALRLFKIDLHQYQPIPLTKADITWASIIICFSEYHRQKVFITAPKASYKTFLLSEITSLNQKFFEDIDYSEISPHNKVLFENLHAISEGINQCLKDISLSIVIPVYNEENVIAHLLRSLLSAISRNNVKEIIIVSSGSNDKTNDIVNKLSKNNPQLIFITEERRRGKVSAFKQAAPLVSGDDVLLLDGDIKIGKEFIESVFECINTVKIPCTGSILPLNSKADLFSSFAGLNCQAWNNLRANKSQTGDYLYPSGYSILLSTQQFKNTINKIDNSIINDDAALSYILFEEGIYFHYSPKIKTYVLFPSSLSDFLKQKVRTRLGRRQQYWNFFKRVEKEWRREVLNLINQSNFIIILMLLFLDMISRVAAIIKYRLKVIKLAHLWSPIRSTKKIY